jgi:hypothetical protein
VIIRPSNSGTGHLRRYIERVMPSSEAAQEARSQVRHSPCKIGISRAAEGAHVPGFVVFTCRTRQPASYRRPPAPS